MKQRKLSLLMALLLLVTSCSEKKATAADYQTSLDIFKAQEAVKILQLTDLHWSLGTDFTRQEAYLKKVVELADPDIVITTGDNVLCASDRDFQHLFSFFDSLTNSKGQPVYWSVTWGNHDRQGFYGPDYPSNLAKSYSLASSYTYGQASSHHGLYKCPEDEVQGRSNYVVNLTDGNKTLWQLWGIDSNSDSYNGSTYDYDVIRQNQIDWYTSLAKTTRGEGTNIPGLAFFHIPLFQSVYSYDEAKKTKIIKEGDFGGELRESEWDGSPLANQGYASTAFYIGYEDTGFFKAAKANGIKGMFYGHDHINDFWALYDDQATATNNPNGTSDDILLAYGTKSGDGLYYDKDMIGGNLITVHKDGSFNGHEASHGTDFQWIHLTYEEANL
jgi:predicted MPP superfamily phosphohydrolase